MSHPNKSEIKNQKSKIFTLPPEWATHDRVWVTPPHNESTWPGRLDDARRQFDVFLEALGQCVTVATCDAPTDDSWIRDYGPLFVLDQHGKKHAHDFTFNGHGNKFPCANDNAATASIIDHVGCPRIKHDLVLEGGAIDVNGAGTILTTEQCLLHPSRNPHLRQQQIENQLHHAFGTRHIVWLHGGLTGDDTDGHVDTVARFVNPTTIVAPRASHGHPDYVALETNWKLLEFARDQDDKPFTLIPLPVPPPMYFDYPGQREVQPGTQTLPATYCNFLIANGKVFLPVYHQPSDEVAILAMRRAMPDHDIIPIRSDILIIGMGALHCLTMHETAG